MKNEEIFKSLVDSAIKTEKPDVPRRKCDVCNIQRRQDSMINFAMVVGSPGHPDLPSFQCQHTEHWACSLAHFEEVVRHCGFQEVKNMLAYLHAVALPQGAGVYSCHYDEAVTHLETQGMTFDKTTIVEKQPELLESEK